LKFFSILEKTFHHDVANHVHAFEAVSVTVPMVANSGHDFSKILILYEQDLLCDLCPLVTTDSRAEVMSSPTGIPPHVELESQLREILNQVSELVVKFSDHTTQVTKAVKFAIDEKSWDSGHATGSRLQEMLTSFPEALLGAVNVQQDSTIRAEFHRVAENGGRAEDDNNMNPFD
jgi:hypothetical protein